MKLKELQLQKRVNKKLFKEFIFYAAIIFFFLYVNPTYVTARTDVEGHSMEGTIKEDDALFIEKVSYHFRNPKRYDIIVFTPFKEEPDKYWVKRIIGMPGETIQIKDKEVYIDGKKLNDDNYGNAKIEVSGVAQDPFLIPQGEYFVMGDNRIGEESCDSRYEVVGTIKEEQIIGRVAVRIFPFDTFRFFN